jgi:hypothetical protein
MNRASRNENAQRAYDVQVRAGTEGAIKFTALGTGLAILGHYTWPFFRYVSPAIALQCGGSRDYHCGADDRHWRSRVSWSRPVSPFVFSSVKK